jgi:hypothetical protein
MLITQDIRDHKILGREFKKATQEGVHQGEFTVLRRQIQHRFGAIPSWVIHTVAPLPGPVALLYSRAIFQRTRPLQRT